MQLTIDKVKCRNAYADNVGCVTPVDFSEENQIEVEAKPFKWHHSCNWGKFCGI